MDSIKFARLRARLFSLAPAALGYLALVLGCFWASGLHAGIVPNSDSEHGDNGTNDPYYLNAGSFTYIRVFNDDLLVMNGGTISNHSRPYGWWRSPIRMLDQSRAIINGGTIRDVDTVGGTWGLHVEDQSRLTINGGTFWQDSGGASPLLYATGSSSTTINGGNFHSVQDSPVGTWFDGDVVINGGTFVSDRDYVVNHRGQGRVAINGGTFSSPSTGVVVRSGELILSGGKYETDLDLHTTGGVTDLIARSASLNGGPLNAGILTATAGVLDLVWPSGMAESLRFQRQAGVIRLTLIPEPTTGALLVAALAWAMGRRKICAKCGHAAMTMREL